MEDEEDRGRPRRRKPDVRIDTKPSVITTGSGETSSSSSIWKLEFKVPSRFKWIQDNLNWSSLKPVIRCSLTAWIATVLFAIPRVEQWMGMASFLILIASFLSPPSDPFVAVVERELLILFFSCLAWAWSCLGIKLASLSRSHVDYSVPFADVIRGGYIEAAPSVIIGIFIGVGSIFFLFIKARLGPGPYLFACIFACITLDITLTTAVFFPFPYYTTGQSIIIPLAIHSAIALTLSLTVFPLTLSASYTTRLQAVLTPLSSVLEQHITLLQSPTGTPEFDQLVEDVISTVKKSEGGLLGVAAAGRLLPNDLTVSRFKPTDFQAFQGFARRITGRVQGMGMYFNLIDPTKSKFPLTPGTSVAPTPTPGTPTSRSRQESVERGEKREESQAPTPKSSRAISPRDSPTLSSGHPHKNHHPHFHLPHHILHQSLTNLSLRRRRRAEHVVGVFESQKYLNLEAKLLRDPRQEEWIQMETELLSEGCVPLLQECSGGIKTVDSWLDHVRHGRFNFFGRTKKENTRARLVEQVVEVQRTLSAALSEFREHGRLRVIEPYHPVVTELGDDESGHHELPPHRHLFHCYVYQYHLIQTASDILEMLEEVLKLEEKRTKVRFWAPVTHIFRWGPHDVPDNADHDDDDDPDVIQGLHPVDSVDSPEDLGLPEKRDPDALPPRNALELIMNTVYHALNSVTAGDSLFAIKAGLISVALCLPFLIRNSAGFAYEHRWAWAIIMGQLTLARFRGDTTFGLAARIIATFAGGLVGMVTWYISAGNGRGSPYGLAAVCGVSFPFFFMVRLYCPIPPMTNIVAFVTAILVLGYSYQATHSFVPGSQGVGWDVAWRRFVLVTIGVVAAFLGSMLPPNMTLRRYQRSLLSTTCTELGTIYCSIITFATFTPRTPERMQQIISSLVATRAKLSKSSALSTNIVYEFSLRGRWPKKRYQQVLELQLSIAYSLSHLMSVVEHLEPSWTRAFLKRARFLDPDFQGDVLAVITMISSSLRTGNPLPQVTPCPLLDRFMMKYHGLDVIHQDSEEDYGLPRLLTLDTLRDEQYMMFSVGIAMAYRIMNRLDRLMLATKEIVGEQYHIHGVGVGQRALNPMPVDSSLPAPGFVSGAGFPLSPSLTSQRGATSGAGVSSGAGVVNAGQRAVKEV